MKLIKVACLCAISMWMVSCTASTVAVNTDYDRDADFTQYRTFYWSDNFQSENGKKNTEPLFYNTLIKKRLKASIEQEMTGRGYKLDNSNPDLLINPQVIVEEKTTNKQYNPSPYYGYYWGASSNTETYNTKQGSIVIDIIDQNKRQLIWQGYAAGVIDTQTEDKQKEIREGVAMIFAKYPYRADENGQLSMNH